MLTGPHQAGARAPHQRRSTPTPRIATLFAASSPREQPITSTTRRPAHAHTALLLACVVVLPACGKLGQEIQDLQSIASAIQEKYNQPVNVTLNTNGELTVLMTHAAAIDTMKFTRTDCTDYAQDVARFAINHYARPTSLSYVWVRVVEVRDDGPARETSTYCTAGGNRGSLVTDNEVPDILKGAGTPPTRHTVGTDTETR